MAPKYAKDQPAGFSNRIEKVALVGASGQVGKFFTEALLNGGNHTVTAITRTNGPNKPPSGVQVAEVDYDDESSLVNALKGQHALVITMAVFAPKDSEEKLIRAAAKAGVPYVMPNNYSPDFLNNQDLGRDAVLGPGLRAASKLIEELGVSTRLTLTSGFWYEYSLAGGKDRYGFDFDNKAVTFFDDGNQKINTSTWAQCGAGLAALLSLKKLPDDANDRSTTLAEFANGVCYVSSFCISQKDMFESVKRVTGATEADWKISYENSKERWSTSMEAMKGGDRIKFVKTMYTRVFFPNGGGDYDSKVVNDKLGLPSEDLDKATERAIQWKREGVFDGWK